MLPHLSGLGLEYAVLQVYTTAVGQREAALGFNIGQGTQDVGYRNDVPVLFDIRPAVKLVLRVRDDDGSPTTGSLAMSAGKTTDVRFRYHRLSGQDQVGRAAQQSGAPGAMTRRFR